MALADEVSTDPVSWKVAERVATNALRLVVPTPPEVLGRLEADFAEATARAEVLVAECTGLVSSAGRAVARVTDRNGWVLANIDSFRRLLSPLGERLAEHPAAKRVLNPGSKTAAGVEMGLLLAFMSGRVLGQYDLLAAGGEEAGGIVYYVGPNVAALERRHDFAPEQFRLWVALHEVTHRAQFTGVPWMRGYFLDIVERGMELTAPDGRTILDALRRGAAEVRSGRNPLAEAGVAGLLATTDQLAALRDAQALMSLLEGHGDVVMSRAAAEAIPGAKRFHDTLAARRSNASGFAKLIQQLLGVEAKLRQYKEGELFIEEVERAGGDELFTQVWRGPEMLPDLDEIRHPQRWISRVGGVATARA